MRVPSFRSTSLLVLLLGACDDRLSPPPERLRLWNQPSLLLPGDAHADKTERTVFEADFERGLEDWRLVADPMHPELDQPLEIAAAARTEGEHTLVTLSGRRGALCTAISVEPGTCYEFEGLVRARGIQPHTARGATFWVGEVEKDRPLQTMLSWQRGGSVRRLEFPSAMGSAGWRHMLRGLRTGGRTHRLFVVCLLSQDELTEGEVDFAELRLRRIPLARYWDVLLTTARAERATIEPLEARSAPRLLSARLGNEDRPSLVLLPGERMRFSLRLPSGTPRFTAGVGPWLRASVAGLGGRMEFVLRVDGRELGRVATAVPDDPEEADWAPLDADLRASAGKEVEIEIAHTGDTPGVLGAPLVADVSRRREGPNLLLISIDTLRADHVGAYGGTSAPTPTLDRLAREGTLCLDANSQAPWTLPSHATMFTGQLPSVHGVLRSERTISSERSPALADLLAEQGFATQCFAAGLLLSAEFGLDRGFEGFTDLDPLRPPESPYFDWFFSGIDPSVVARRQERYGLPGIERWIDDHREQRFFLFVHTYAVHDCDPPPGPCAVEGCTSTALRYSEEFPAEKMGPADLAHLVHGYDAALTYVDARIGELLEHLQELGLSDDTIVVVTSDHGEEMLEHGRFQHGDSLYSELLHVPLILRVPGRAPGTVERPVMLIDVAPTCLALLGLPADPRMQGIDLLAEGWPARPIWGEVGGPGLVYSLREEDGWKVIRRFPGSERDPPERLELFHLSEDPHETRDLAQGDPARAGELERKVEELRALYTQLGESLGSAGSGEVDPSLLERLRAFGYVR